MTRKTQLEKAMAFDGTILPYKHFPMLVIGEGEQFALVNEYTKHGMKLASLATLHAALLEAVEALKCNETFHSLGGIDDCEPCKALAKIDKALEGMV